MLNEWRERGLGSLQVLSLIILGAYRRVIQQLTVEFKPNLDPSKVLDRLKKHNIGTDVQLKNIQVSNIIVLP